MSVTAQFENGTKVLRIGFRFNENGRSFANTKRYRVSIRERLKQCFRNEDN